MRPTVEWRRKSLTQRDAMCEHDASEMNTLSFVLKLGFAIRHKKKKSTIENYLVSEKISYARDQALHHL